MHRIGLRETEDTFQQERVKIKSPSNVQELEGHRQTDAMTTDEEQKDTAGFQTGARGMLHFPESHKDAEIGGCPHLTRRALHLFHDRQTANRFSII
jgi:hypothetical protein